jgi:hypothetical protein
MAATVKKNIWLQSTADGVAPETRANQKIAASQGILIPNAPMYLSTAGTWKAMATADGTTDYMQGLLVGLQNAGSTWPLEAELAGDTEIRVLIIDPDDTYAVYVENNTADAAATQTYVGEQYGLTVSATAGAVGYTTMDVNNANALVRVIQVMGNVEPTKHDLTTAPGVALVKVLAANSTQAGELA